MLPIDLSYTALTSQYEDLLKETIVMDEEPLPNLFDIGKFPHYEDVSSNWYEFYINPKQPHGFGNLFLDSLLQLINEHEEVKESFDLELYNVQREYNTDKGGFIDLVLLEGASDKEITRAIIIENKIKATLYNDLDDYYDSVHVSEGKIAIALTLRPSKIPEKIKNPYINITHNQWLNRVKRNMGDHLIQADARYLTYLKDFIQNFENMTETRDTTDSVKYYIENGAKIQQLIGLKANAEKFVTEDLYVALNDSEWIWKRKGANTVSLNHPDCPVVCYVYFDELFDKDLYWIEMYMHGKEAVKKWHEQKLELLQKKFPNMKHFDHKPDNTEWQCMARIEYNNINNSTKEKFGRVIVEKLKTEWKTYMDDVITMC